MNDQVENIRNPIIRRIAYECTMRSTGVNLEEFAQKCIKEFSVLQRKSSKENEFMFMGDEAPLSVVTSDAMKEMGIK